MEMPDLDNLNKTTTTTEAAMNIDEFFVSKVKINELSDNLKKKFTYLEEKLINNFEILQTSLELRKNSLLQELNAFFNEKQAILNDNLNNLTNEKENQHVCNPSLFAFLGTQLDFSINNELVEKNDLNSLIKTYGRLLVTNKNDNTKENINSNENLNECKLDGIGLKQCYLNEFSNFTLRFLNKNGTLFNSTNSSLLDIFIVSSSNEKILSKKSNQISKFVNNDNSKKSTTSLKTSIVSAQTTSSSTVTNLKSAKSNTILFKDRSKSCNCECKLEHLADGLYQVNYKLDKKGVFLLNILVDKVHVADSPYKIICLENNKKMSTLKKKPAKTQSSFNITSGSSSANALNLAPCFTMPSPSTIESRNKTIKIKSPRTSSMSHLSNISNTSINSNSTTRRSKAMSPMNLSFSQSINKSHSTNGFNTNNLNNQANSSGSNFSSKSFNTSLSRNDENLALSNLTSVLSSRNPSPYSFFTAKSTPQSNSEFILDLGKEDDFLFKIGSRGRNNAEFQNPQAVCATNDLIFITDSNNQKVDAFTHSGEFKFCLGNGMHTKMIRRPIGIESTEEKKILVVDYELKCVNMFDENGKFLSRLCQGKLLGPKGIAINKSCHNQIVIADSKANSICIFDSIENGGKFIQRFGNLGNKNENFAGPQYVACLSNADIVVSDFYNHCIKVFDSTGKFRLSFGSNGLNQGQFNGPTGIAADSSDNLIICDWGNSRIQVFDKNGNFIRYINTEVNQLYGPQDLTIINNTIAVADSGNHCVKIFEYS